MKGTVRLVATCSIISHTHSVPFSFHVANQISQPTISKVLVVHSANELENLRKAVISFIYHQRQNGTNDWDIIHTYTSPRCVPLTHFYERCFCVNLKMKIPKHPHTHSTYTLSSSLWTITTYVQREGADCLVAFDLRYSRKGVVSVSNKPWEVHYMMMHEMLRPLMSID